ncbi:hypothetical protein Tco_0665711, partial [Tanacetum coccineum]
DDTDDDDADDDEEEPFEDEEDDEEEEVHLALTLFPRLGIQRHSRLMSLHPHLDHLRSGSPLPRCVSVG